MDEYIMGYAECPCLLYTYKGMHWISICAPVSAECSVRLVAFEKCQQAGLFREDFMLRKKKVGKTEPL